MMMDTSLERKNLYRRQRVGLPKSPHTDSVQIRERNNHGFLPALIFAILLWGLIFISCQLTLNILNPTGAAGDTSAFETYVVSGIFKDTGAQSAYVTQLELWIQSFLGYVLPTMSLVSITLVLLSLVATVLYLFKQEYFDDVYLAKKAVQGERRKRSSGGGNGAGGVQGMLNGVGGMFKGIVSGDAVVQYGIIKCYIMPNMKAWAFYEASEGRMTVMDFFKKNALKCIMMFSFCILISDQTMLELFLKGASVGTYVFKRAAEVDYVTYIDNFLTTGSDYVPYYSSTDTQQANKLKTYNAGYQILKSLCDKNDEYQRSTDFKTYMGQTLVDYIDNDMNQVPFDRANFVVKCETIDYTSYQRVLSNTGQTSESHVVPTDTLFGGEYLSGSYLRFYFTTSNSSNTSGSVVATTDVAAWSTESNVITWDYSQITIDGSTTSKAMAITDIGYVIVETMKNGHVYSQRFTGLELKAGDVTCYDTDSSGNAVTTFSSEDDLLDGSLEIVDIDTISRTFTGKYVNENGVTGSTDTDYTITYDGSPAITGLQFTPADGSIIRSIYVATIQYVTGTYGNTGVLTGVSSMKGGSGTSSTYLNPNASSILASQTE